MPRTGRVARFTPSRLLLVGAALSLAFHAGRRPAFAESAKDSQPATKQVTARAKMQELIAQYRSTKPDVNERARIVGELLELGDEGARRAAAELAKDFRAR